MAVKTRKKKYIAGSLIGAGQALSTGYVGTTDTPPVSFSIPVGATFTWIGDGLSDISSGVGSGASNPGHQFQNMMGMRVQPTAFPIMGLSGTTIKTQASTNFPWIMPFAIDAMMAQYPNIAILGTCGANDNLLSVDPGTNPASGFTTSTWLQDDHDAVAYLISKFKAQAGINDLLIIVGTAPSTKTGETVIDSGQTQDRRTRVWAAQAAQVATQAAGDARIIFVPLTGMLPPTNYSVDVGSTYVHLDERGAAYIASRVKAAIDAKVENKTPDEIIDMMIAGTYPLVDTQLDTDTALVGTGGTITGPGVTGTLATSKVILNTTGATGITVGQITTTAGRTKTVVDFSAATNTSAAGRIIIQDKVSTTITATPGRSVMTGMLVRASAGYWNFGCDWNGNNWGKFGGGGSSLAANGKAGAGSAQSLSTIFVSNPLPVYGNSTTFAAKRTTGFFWPINTPLTGTLEFERPFAYVINERTRHAPTYLGDVMSGAGIRPPTGAAAIASFPAPCLRPSGTISQAAGGTIRVEPGLWSPRGMTEADFASRRIYKGSAANTAVGSGTLLATISGSTWTATIAAGAVTTGDFIYVEMDVNNGVGSGVTVRSLATITAT